MNDGRYTMYDQFKQQSGQEFIFDFPLNAKTMPSATNRKAVINNIAEAIKSNCKVPWKHEDIKRKKRFGPDGDSEFTYGKCDEAGLVDGEANFFHLSPSYKGVGTSGTDNAARLSIDVRPSMKGKHVTLKVAPRKRSEIGWDVPTSDIRDLLSIFGMRTSTDKSLCLIADEKSIGKNPSICSVVKEV